MFTAKKAKSDLSGSILRFSDVRREPNSRYKHLRLHLDQFCKETEELKQFAEQHMTELFQLFLDLFLQAEPVLYASSARLNLSELESALWLLEAMLQNLPEEVSLRWQYVAIGSCLRRLLHPQSLIGLRRIGLKLFLLWYQCLGQGPYGAAELDVWFSNLIPNIVGPDGHMSDIILQEICEHPGYRVLSVSSSANEECQFYSRNVQALPVAVQTKRIASKAMITQSFMEKALEFISSDFTKVLWAKQGREFKQICCLRCLIDSVYSHYVALCCPSVQYFNIDTVAKSVSFDPFCESEQSAAIPPGQQYTDEGDEYRRICVHVLIRWIALYASSYKHSTVGEETMNASDSSLVGRQKNNSIVDSFSPLKSAESSRLPSNYSIVRKTLLTYLPLCSRTYSILRESFLLPLNHVGTIARVFRVLREWLLQQGEEEESQPSEATSDVVSFHMHTPHGMKLAIVILMSFFDSPYLNFANDFAQQNATLVAQICVRILTLFKHLACSGSTFRISQDTWHFLLKALLHTVHRVLPPLPADCTPVSTIVASQVYQTLLVTWVFASLNAPLPVQLWDNLVDTCQKRTDWSALVFEWGKVMESITRALALEVYSVDLLDPPLERPMEHRLKQKQALARQLFKSVTQESGSSIFSSDTESPSTKNSQELNSQQNPLSLLLSSSSRRQSERPLAICFSVPNSSDLMLELPSQKSPSNASNCCCDSTSEAVEHSREPESAIECLAEEVVISEDSDSYDSGSAQFCSAESNSIAGMKSMLLSEDILTESTIMSTNDADTVSDEFSYSQEVEQPSAQSMPQRIALLSEQDGANGNGTAPEALGVVWKRILCCLGNINRVTSPEIHVHMMDVIRLVLSLLVKIRNNQDSCPSLVPPTVLLIPWLSETLRLPEPFAASKMIATRLYCFLLSQRRDIPLSDVTIADFFCIASSILTGRENALINTFLVSCSASLVRELWPSCLFLLPDLVAASARIMKTATVDCVDSVDKVNVVHFVSSIVLLAPHRPTFPTCQDSQKVMDSNVLQMEVFRCLVDSLHNDSVNDGDDRLSTALALRGLSVLLHSLLRNNKLNGIVEGCFETILDYFAYNACSFSSIVCQLLNSLFPFCRDLSENHFRLMRHLFSVYNAAAEQLLAKESVNETEKKEMVALLERICNDLVEWLLLIPGLVVGSYVGQEPSPLLSVLRLAELLMYRQRCIKPNDDSAQGVFEDYFQVLAISLFAILNCCFDQKIFYAYPAVSASEREQLFGVGLRQKKFIIAKLSHLCGHSEDELQTVISSRTVVGQHIWKVRRLKLQSRWKSAANEWLHDSVVNFQDKSFRTPPEEFCRLPDDQQVDHHAMDYYSPEKCHCPLNCLIDYLHQFCIDCLPSPSTLSCDGYYNDYVSSKANYQACDQKLVTGATLLVEVGFSNFDAFDLAFSNSVMSLSCLDSLDDVVLLDQTQQAERHFRHIDSTASRELHKIAVIYVAAGQEDKQSILENRDGSPRFEEFVSGLGWQVELRTHSGYAGGLPTEGTIPYYCTPLIEVVFHVSTRLSCEEITRKLRHIGNDEVHIVWSEHWRDYRRSIIPTEFCDVLIVIYPLADDLFRIQVDYDDTEIDEFGPLFNDAIVHWSVLACLVRSTAINASRLKRRSISGYRNAHHLRLMSISEMIQEAPQPTSLSHILTNLYSPIVPTLSTPC
ncbi:Rho GTPase activating protein [Trichuris trichiura]|uniref:Rho GTPase activating protein n=1 Tax=Trichuris trichiura TaxID=36087 RepID=A0A077ZCL2_TRITR|nr:Rho GTPase activating protein [Trichuris trichiura]